MSVDVAIIAHIDAHPIGFAGRGDRDVVHNIEVAWLLHTTYSERTVPRMSDGRHNDLCG